MVDIHAYQALLSSKWAMPGSHFWLVLLRCSERFKPEGCSPPTYVTEKVQACTYGCSFPTTLCQPWAKLTLRARARRFSHFVRA